MTTQQKLWQPSPAAAASSNLTRFSERIGARYGVELPEYAALHAWSIDQREAFWREVWEFAGVVASSRGERVLVDGDRMPGTRWFPDARLNFAENLLRRRDEQDALVFHGEDRVARRMSHVALHEAVSRLAAAMRDGGIGAGDRVAAFLPNMPEAVIGMLAATSIGAIWSSCSPDFGVEGVVDRFGQIEPRLLFAVDGYWYNGKSIGVVDKVAAIRDRLPSLERVVVSPYLHAAPDLSPIRDAVAWEEYVAPHPPGAIEFAQLPFDHPAYVMYSSGTTGVPKCIVHGAGGTLLQHLKEHVLHGDLRADERIYYFTTCGWMMWNWLASALAVGATLVLYDGSPFIDRGRALWQFVDGERVTHFGASAKYIDAARKIGLVPRKDFPLDALRVVYSTGSPLAPESFDYVYQCFKDDVRLSSIAGGTDIVSCFVLGCPTRPVWRGEIQCRGLGMAVEVFDESGHPVRGRKGELVCTRSFPSMPICFWNDPDGSKYRAAYFERFPGVWTHGDWVEITEHDGMVIYGRSDATLNPGGVRIGTAEIYRQVEQLDEVLESLVIGQDWPPGELSDVRVILFVKLFEGVTLDQALIDRIKTHIRVNTTPRHVPAKIIQVPDIPRTKSNKIVELAVRSVVHGEPVRNIEALANPEALEYFRDLEELKS